MTRQFLGNSSIARPAVSCAILASILLLGLLPVSSQSVQAQKPPSERVYTELQFDIVFPRERQNGVAAQQWAELFSTLNVPLRIRQPAFNDKAGVTQQTFGTIRRVQVTGQLDRSGMIVFPDRKFRTTDSAKLAEWIEELRVYGAQGAPTGQPLWGLKQAEFDRLHALMKQPVEQTTVGLKLTDAIRALELPNEYPLRFSAATRERLIARGELPLVKNELQKFAKGTALAMLLRGYDLAFSPRRLPDESIVIAVDPYEEEIKTWPIGWDPESLGYQRLAISGKMFTARMIGIEQQTLADLIPVIENETELPVCIDPQALTALDLDLEQLVVNYPRKRTSWSLCLRTVLSQVKLTQQVRVDENDRPFIWITKFVPRTAALLKTIR